MRKQVNWAENLTIAHYDNTPFWIPAGTINDDLECPIHLKVRFTDGTLGVRTLWLSDSTIRTGITRGGGGEWAGGPNPPPSIHVGS